MSNNDVWTADATLSCPFSICRLFRWVNSIGMLPGMLPGSAYISHTAGDGGGGRDAEMNSIDDGALRYHLQETCAEVYFVFFALINL